MSWAPHSRNPHERDIADALAKILWNSALREYYRQHGNYPIREGLPTIGTQSRQTSEIEPVLEIPIAIATDITYPLEPAAGLRRRN